MAEWWWKFRYAYWMHRMVGLSFDFCWDSATAALESQDFLEDGYTPREAVEIELSYWND